VYTNHRQFLAFFNHIQYIKKDGADLVYGEPGNHKNILTKFHVKNPCAETAFIHAVLG
jgi:hypothetical protein